LAKAQDTLALGRRAGLPDALRVLMEAYPRASWEQHPNFGEMVRFWMQRHAMFRQLSEVLRNDVERHLDGALAFDEYASRLAQYGGLLLQELHAHHHIEDSHYFPRLITLEPRLEQGFDLLERDHDAMDGLLQDMAKGANAVLQADENVDVAGVFSEELSRFSTLLERHLTDEEEIVVPVILKSGFSG
jgi:hemerythrin-like domain-containing protein